MRPVNLAIQVSHKDSCILLFSHRLLKCSLVVGLQDALDKERQKTQQLLEEKERLATEREWLAEEKTTKAIEEVEARHNASNQALYELFVVSHLFIFTQRMNVMFVYISN